MLSQIPQWYNTGKVYDQNENILSVLLSPALKTKLKLETLRELVIEHEREEEIFRWGQRLYNVSTGETSRFEFMCLETETHRFFFLKGIKPDGAQS